MASNPQSDCELWLEAGNTLGEGPIMHPERCSLIWFDVPEARMFERPLAGGPPRLHDLGVMASAAALVDERRVLIATETDLKLFDLDTGVASSVIPFLPGRPDLRSNDSCVHPAGAFWISSMGKRAETDAGAIWWFRAGELRLIYERITIGNAICFTPDGMIAYFADSARRTIWRVVTDPETGLPAGEPDVFRVFTDGEGEPDGAVVDADGRVWVASWGSSAVFVLNPDGSLHDTCTVPVSQPTCPAFIGDHLDGMLLTSAREGLSAAALDQEPLAGSVFHIRRKVKGVPEPRIRLA